VRTCRLLLFCSLIIGLGFVAGVTRASAQSIEIVGSRALGMGGAFVAVANDSSATWWNPAGLAAGPFLDVALARTVMDIDEVLPAARAGASSFALATPPIGISYYRLRITDIRTLDPTAQDRADREDTRAGVAIRSLSVSQFGATILHTLLTGIHAGATVKYVRGTVRSSEIEGTEAVRLAIPDLLGRGDDLEGGDGEGGFNLDIGVLAVAGAIRIGGLVRNLREQEFDPSTSSGSPRAESRGDGIQLPRQVRVGAAFDGEAVGMLPVTIALDADLRTYATGSGDRRVVAIGGEHWLFARRVGVRGGARFNTVGFEDRAVTAGASAALRAGLYIDGHVVHGGSIGEGGWGIAARVSF
jgi:hypothetical protein